MIPGNLARHLSTGLAALLLCASAGAQVLDLPAAPIAQPERPLLNLAMPARGADMAQVERRFGPPRERLPAVGHPPITRWVYDGYTVYFEYRHVVHSVLNPR